MVVVTVTNEVDWCAQQRVMISCYVLIRLHISRSYVGLLLSFLLLPSPEALYDTDLV